MLDEVIASYLDACDAGVPPAREDFVARHPSIAPELNAFLDNQARLRTGPARSNESNRTTRTVMSAAPGQLREHTTALTDLSLKPAAASRQPIAKGAIFGGRYRVFDVAAGGMGRVYLADDLQIGPDDAPLKVAIKSVVDFEEWDRARTSRGLPSDVAAYHNLLARFRREALTWIKLGMHQNIIWAMWLLDVGAKPYLVMEYADGGDLRTLMQARRLTVPEVVGFAVQFCEGMKHAVRTAGVVHRDIKPANILITSNAVLKIADFGLAKSFDVETEDDALPESPSDVATSDVAMGTRAYMAPEQFHSLSNADTRSDIFSFGATLFEMLTGLRLFAEQGAAMWAALAQPVPVLTEIDQAVPGSLSDLVARCLQFDPQRRFQTFEALSAALLPVSDSLPGRLPIPVDASHERRAPLFTRSLQLLGETYALISLGRHREAAACAADAIAIDPGNYEHWINRGMALLGERDFAGARECWLQAARLKPDEARTWANLAWANLELGDASEGRTAALRAIRCETGCADGWMARGASERALGQLSEAVVSSAHAARLEPYNWKAHLNLGYCLQDLKRYDEALESLTRALTINPREAHGWLQVGWLHSRRCSWHEARQALDHSLRLDPANAAAWAMRAWALWSDGREIPEARMSLRRALEIDPSNHQAKVVNQVMSGA